MRNGGFGLQQQRDFFLQLSILFGASVNLMDSISIIRQGETDAQRSALIGAVARNLSHGHTLTESLRQSGVTFSSRVLASVQLGEATGGLGHTLHRLSDDLGKELELRKQVVAGATYPLILALSASLAVVGMLCFIFPRMLEFAESLGTQFPASLLLLMRIGDYLLNPLMLFIFVQVGVALFWGLKNQLNEPKTRYALEKAVYHLPVIGHLIQNLFLYHFSQELHSLLSCGCPMLKGLKLQSDGMSNSFLRAGVEEVMVGVRNGQSFADSLAAAQIFDQTFCALMMSAEEAGAIAKTLGVMAKFYRRRVEDTLDQVTALIEPAVLLFLGVVVGLTTLAFFLPMVHVISTL